MRDYTLDEFNKNLERALSLVGVYELSRAGVRGRRSVSASDVLRAATVFLHSALEEVIRNLFRWKLPNGSEKYLDEIPLLGANPAHRPAHFLLGKLAPHRGRFVDNVILDSIEAYVDHMNINNTTELCHCLEMISIRPGSFSKYYGALEKMMARRHQIVHQMDRNEAGGAGQHRAQSISVQQVKGWAYNLKAFVLAVVADVPD